MLFACLKIAFVLYVLVAVSLRLPSGTTDSTALCHIVSHKTVDYTQCTWTLFDNCLTGSARSGVGVKHEAV